MSNNHDSFVLRELADFSTSLSPSVQVEHSLAEIRDTYLTSPLAKIPFKEIAALGGSFAGVVESMASPAAEGLYRCVFPKGVTGTLASAKGGGSLGTIMNHGIVGQARWYPVEQSIAPACLKATLVAVAVLAVVKQIQDIKDGQKEIVGILERDKKSQLLADYDLLASYMDDYKYYWENEASLVVNLNQVKNIKRNAMKDIRSYAEQIEGMISAKRNLLKMQSASQKIGQILDRFVHYKLALHVFALAEYMEVMLSKNFQAEYLSKIAEEIREHAFKFRILYTAGYDKIETLKKDAITTQAANKLADISRSVGNLIGKIPVVKDGPVDEFLFGVGDSISDAEKKQLEKVLSFFVQYKDSGLMPVAEHIDMVNHLSNKPVVMLYDKNVIHFHALKEAV
ncbi:MAG: hypothetical protein IJB11_01410 [Oscillospiraceae bacterium]|nr:hypothetical protein [Oscillospiraceae bacterium]